MDNVCSTNTDSRNISFRGASPFDSDFFASAARLLKWSQGRDCPAGGSSDSQGGGGDSEASGGRTNSVFLILGADLLDSLGEGVLGFVFGGPASTSALTFRSLSESSESSALSSLDSFSSLSPSSASQSSSGPSWRKSKFWDVLRSSRLFLSRSRSRRSFNSSQETCRLLSFFWRAFVVQLISRGGMIPVSSLGVFRIACSVLGLSASPRGFCDR
mmetsp:Transcript_21552/g.52776  ORF Transcript_21552/g.52776 Transcript_21552/m.52776 type:complete len:215 (+) Transcript_21552:604-1248(+)